jgi:hypothetical protein
MDRHEERRIKIEAEFKSTQLKIRLYLIPASILLLLAILFPILAWFEFLLPAKEKTWLWFQRSGSITVMLAVIIEYFLIKIEHNVNPPNTVPSKVWNMGKGYHSWHKLIQVIAVFVAIFGTLIWGYGDLLKNT